MAMNVRQVTKPPTLKLIEIKMSSKKYKMYM